MNNISKRFVAWAINFKTNLFSIARLKLTVQYTVGMFILLVIFNLGVYGLFISDIPDTFETSLSVSQRQTVDRAGERLERALFLVDGLMIIAILGFGYYFAGQTLGPIEKMYKRQKKFVADVAHELRTPLSVIKAGAETVLLSTATNEAYKKLIGESLEEIDYMSNMVNDLLFLANNDDNKRLVFNRVDLLKLVDKQVEFIKSYANKKGITLVQNCQNGYYIQGNEAYLKRLLTNLLQNAIDYNKPGGTVTVSLQNNNQEIELTVVDTGIGILKDDMPHIFDRFYKADRARTHRSDGTGLGLSIAKEIVQLHHGHITVKSYSDKGTAVRVVFPSIV